MLADDHREDRSPSDPAEDEPAPAPATRERRGLRPALVGATAVLGVLALLGVAALVVWPLVSPPDPDTSLRLVDGRLIGELSGYVVQVDRESQTVAVSPSLFGVRPLALAVSRETVISVRDRQGGFGDLWKDVPVRVWYEVVGDRRVARSIEIGPGEAAGAPRATSPPAPAIRPAEALPPPTPPATVAAPSRPGPGRPPAPARVVEPAPTPATTAERPSRPVRARTEKPPATPPESPGPGLVPGVARQAEPPSRADDSRDTDIADGTAAIDWLFKEAGRR